VCLSMDEYLTSTWEEFEAWIRSAIGSNFGWKVRPLDNYSNRKMIADLIRDAMKPNIGFTLKSHARGKYMQSCGFKYPRGLSSRLF